MPCSGDDLPSPNSAQGLSSQPPELKQEADGRATRRSKTALRWVDCWASCWSLPCRENCGASGFLDEQIYGLTTGAKAFAIHSVTDILGSTARVDVLLDGFEPTSLPQRRIVLRHRHLPDPARSFVLDLPLLNGAPSSSTLRNITPW